jgi:hypothetical protein
MFRTNKNNINSKASSLFDLFFMFFFFTEMDSDRYLILQYPDQYFCRLISDHYHRLYSVVSKVRSWQLFITYNLILIKYYNSSSSSSTTLAFKTMSSNEFASKFPYIKLTPSNPFLLSPSLCLLSSYLLSVTSAFQVVVFFVVHSLVLFLSMTLIFSKNDLATLVFF